MTWSAPMTAVADSVLTASQFNAFVRDNLNETAPAKATTAGSIFVATGINAIAQRIPSTQFVTDSESTSSTSYTDLATAGPAVTVTTGTTAIVVVDARLINTTAGQNTYASYAVSGVSSSAANDDRAFMFTCPVANYSTGGSNIILHTGLTAGSHTFTMQYRVTGGTGTIDNRRLTVIPL